MPQPKRVKHRKMHRGHRRGMALTGNEVSFGEKTPILDLHEALPDWERDIDEARAYVEWVIDHIWESVPALIARLPHFPGTRRPVKP